MHAATHAATTGPKHQPPWPGSATGWGTGGRGSEGGGTAGRTFEPIGWWSDDRCLAFDRWGVGGVPPPLRSAMNGMVLNLPVRTPLASQTRRGKGGGAFVGLRVRISLGGG